MIPWWGWLALWVSLVLALLVVLALSAWLLFRKFVRMLDDFGHLAESTIVFDGVDSTAAERRPIAILEPYAEIVDRFSSRRQRTSLRRANRARRRIARGTAIIAVDPLTIHLIAHREARDSKRR